MNTRETITPTDEAHWLQMRTQDLTSTDIAALFGLSPYTTAFEVWHRKKSGQQPEFKQNDRMKWGTRLEEVVARGIAEDQGWAVQPMKDYMRLPELRLGSSFDFRILTPTAGQVGCTGASKDDTNGILEIKTVDIRAFKQGWLVDDDSIEAPAHIELQLQHQMLVSGLRWGYIGALVGGNDVRLIRREADQQVHLAIMQKAAAFWKSIDTNQPPSPVYPQDAAAVIAMHQHAEPGLVIEDASVMDLCEQYRALGEQAKTLEDERSTIKARLLERIGEAEKVRAGQFTISAGIMPGGPVSYERKSYRDFRVTQKKEKSK
jgi:putative phage-type endonuclease